MTKIGTVKLAAVAYQTGFQIDEFLIHTANLLRADHIRLGGILQENTRNAAGSCSAMTLIDLTSQNRFGISQDLGSQAQGCRLDPHGLTEIGALLDRSLDRTIELLVLNKFGKAEAEGGGLRSVFAHVIETGIPLLTAVRPPYIKAWSEFHGGLAVDLPTDLGRVFEWCGDAVRELRAARPAKFSPTV